MVFDSIYGNGTWLAFFVFVEYCSLRAYSFPGSNFPQVKKIVQGQFDLFKSMYNPLIQEYEAKEFLRFSSYGNHQANVSQVCINLKFLISMVLLKICLFKISENSKMLLSIKPGLWSVCHFLPCFFSSTNN